MGISNFQGQGANYVPAYQTSGTPFAKTVASVSSTVAVRITFPYVTRWITVSASDNALGGLRIGFSEQGVEMASKMNYYYLPLSPGGSGTFVGQTPRLELRCKEIWLMGDAGAIATVSVIAGMTGISKDQFPVLSGSQGFDGVG